MSVIALAILSFCSWAVFSRHFCDGIVAKHLFVFGAITAALVVLDPRNITALYWAVALCVAGVAYWAIKHYRDIVHLITEL